MIQLQVSKGEGRGTVMTAQKLPVVFGRGSKDDWRVETCGVWESHFQIESAQNGEFLLKANPEALTLVQGKRISEVRLCPGDVIEIGGLALVFGFSGPVQSGLRHREIFVWILVLMMLVLQLGIAGALFWDAWNF